MLSCILTHTNSIFSGLLWLGLPGHAMPWRVVTGPGVIVPQLGVVWPCRGMACRAVKCRAMTCNGMVCTGMVCTGMVVYWHGAPCSGMVVPWHSVALYDVVWIAVLWSAMTWHAMA